MLKEHANLFEDRKAAVSAKTAYIKGACFTTWCTICSDGQASHLLLLLLLLSPLPVVILNLFISLIGSIPWPFVSKRKGENMAKEVFIFYFLCFICVLWPLLIFEYLVDSDDF